MMKKTPINMQLDFGEQYSALHAPEVTGQAAQVLSLIREHGPILNVDLKLTYGITEAAARIHELIDMGFNVMRVRVGEFFCHGRPRKNLVAYVLGSPEWSPSARGGVAMTAQTQTPSRPPADDHARWQLYEVLKAQYTASATSSAEHQAAHRQAAREAGV